MESIKEALKRLGLTQAKASEIIGMPLSTMEGWCRGLRTPPDYVERLVIAELERIGEKVKLQSK